MEARLIVGFHGGEFNAMGQFFRIRQKDAHAWVEVRLPDRGWTTFDPTPAADSTAGHNKRSWLASIKRTYDFLQFEWASLVVSFDVPHRKEMFEALGRWWSQITSRKHTDEDFGS